MKISDDEMKGLKNGCSCCGMISWRVNQTVDEAIASRALVAELRALAERWRSRFADDDGYERDHVDLGKEIATLECLRDIDSLLASHGAAQTEKDAEEKR